MPLHRGMPRRRLPTARTVSRVTSASRNPTPARQDLADQVYLGAARTLLPGHHHGAVIDGVGGTDVVLDDVEPSRTTREPVTTMSSLPAVAAAGASPCKSDDASGGGGAAASVSIAGGMTVCAIAACARLSANTLQPISAAIRVPRNSPPAARRRSSGAVRSSATCCRPPTACRTTARSPCPPVRCCQGRRFDATGW